MVRLTWSALMIGILCFSCLNRKQTEPVNTLHLSMPFKLKGLDPIHVEDIYAGEQARYVYEGLLQYHYLKRPYELIPQLAESMPQISKDQKTYLFTLKKGVMFQDDPCFVQTKGKGRELVAEDFVYSWKRLADSKTRAEDWGSYDGKILGLNEWREKSKVQGTSNYAAVVEGLQAVDRYTLKVTLTRPYVQFLFMLALPTLFVVPHEAVEKYGDDFARHPVGTGPYRLTDYSIDTRLIWDRNPSFRNELYPVEGEPGDLKNGLLEDAGKSLPRNDRVVTQVIEQDQTGWLTFLSGRLDISPIPKDNFSEAVVNGQQLSQELKEKGIQLNRLAPMSVSYIPINLRDPILGKNLYLRQALSAALDREVYIKHFSAQRAVPAVGPIPSGLLNPNAAITASAPESPFSLEKAQKLLAKAGYPHGKGLPPLKLLMFEGTTNRQKGEFLQKTFAQIGIKIEIVSYAWPTYLAKLRQGEGHLSFLGQVAVYPDAQTLFQSFYSKIAANDFSPYSNAEFDRLFERSQQAMSQTSRVALYQQMSDLIVKDCPWIFVIHKVDYELNQPWVKNLKAHHFTAKAKYLSVDPTLKKR